MMNRLTKQSYFIKRLRDSGYVVDRLVNKFSETDPRIWMILINARTDNIVCTCYSHHGECDGIDPKSQNYFEIFDGGQFVPGRVKIDTNSIEVFIERLYRYGISPVYQGKKKEAEKK